jgi:hypothetical protein
MYRRVNRQASNIRSESIDTPLIVLVQVRARSHHETSEFETGGGEAKGEHRIATSENRSSTVV